MSILIDLTLVLVLLVMYEDSCLALLQKTVFAHFQQLWVELYVRVPDHLLGCRLDAIVEGLKLIHLACFSEVGDINSLERCLEVILFLFTRSCRIVFKPYL